MRFLSIRESIVQGTTQSAVVFIFEAWKCDFAQSYNPGFNDTKFRVFKFSACAKFRVCKFSSFWLPENAIAESVEIFSIFETWKCNFSEAWNPSSVWANFPHVRSFVWANFPHFGAWKCDFYWFLKPMFQGTSQRVWKFSSFLRP